MPEADTGSVINRRTTLEKAEELLAMSKTQFKTTECDFSVKNHFQSMKLSNGYLDCRLCEDDIETVEYILCYCEAIARQKVRLFGIMEPEDVCFYSTKNWCCP